MGGEHVFLPGLLEAELSAATFTVKYGSHHRVFDKARNVDGVGVLI